MHGVVGNHVYSVVSKKFLHLASVPASGAAAAAVAVVASAGSGVGPHKVLVDLDLGSPPAVVGMAVVPLAVAYGPAVLGVLGTVLEVVAAVPVVGDGRDAAH